MEKTILSISGKSGLFVLVSRGRSTLIVESIDEQKKRFPVGLHDRVTSLNDVSMYTDGDDISLMKVFKNIYDKQNGALLEFDPKKADKAQLQSFMETDRDRVYPNDMRKLALWYNILVKNGMTDFVNEEEEVSEEKAAE